MYNSIDNLPIVIFFKIIETNDLSLLNADKPQEVWEKIYEEYKAIDPNNTINKTVRLKRQIDGLTANYRAVRIAVELLKKQKDSELIEMLQSNGYTLTKQNFNSDLDTIVRESKALMLQVETLKDELPETTTKGADIFKVLASFSSILGFDFDYNKISVRKYLAVKEQVENKVKAHG